MADEAYKIQFKRNQNTNFVKNNEENAKLAYGEPFLLHTKDGEQDVYTLYVGPNSADAEGTAISNAAEISVGSANSAKLADKVNYARVNIDNQLENEGKLSGHIGAKKEEGYNTFDIDFSALKAKWYAQSEHPEKARIGDMLLSNKVGEIGQIYEWKKETDDSDEETWVNTGTNIRGKPGQIQSINGNTDADITITTEDLGAISSVSTEPQTILSDLKIQGDLKIGESSYSPTTLTDTELKIGGDALNYHAHLSGYGISLSGNNNGEDRLSVSSTGISFTNFDSSLQGASVYSIVPNAIDGNSYQLKLPTKNGTIATLNDTLYRHNVSMIEDSGSYTVYLTVYSHTSDGYDATAFFTTPSELENTVYPVFIQPTQDAPELCAFACYLQSTGLFIKAYKQATNEVISWELNTSNISDFSDTVN